MRSIIIAFALSGGIVFAGPTYAQSTSSPSAAPKYPTAPVGHRQPRASDFTNSPSGSNPPSTTQTPDTSAPDMLDPDGRLNRALNSVCRGC